MSGRTPGTEMTVPAGEIQEGDFLPGLDSGYVFMQPERENLGGDLDEVTVWFHDADGEECRLICSERMPVTIKRTT